MLMKEGWEYKKLGDFIEEVSVRDKGKGYPVYSVTNTKGFCQEFFGKNVASEDTSNYKVVPMGCFAYNPSRINVGSVAWQNKEENVSVSPLYVVFSVSPKLRQDYLLYYIKSNYSMTFINALSRGAVRNNLRLSTLKTFKIPYASISEQQQIVEELDLLSAIIEKKKAQLNELDNLAQSLFYEMFGDPVANEKGWEIDTLENVVSDDCSISYGIVQPGNEIENGIPVVRPVDMTNSVIYRKGLKTIEKTISDSYKRTILSGGELLLCVRGTTGIMSFASDELDGCNVTRGITPLSFGRRINKYYAFHYLSTKYMQSIIAEKTYGIALKQINMKEVRVLPILLPPLSLQQQFASKIEAIEHQKELIKQSIKEVETLFNSRMDYYFN